MKSIDWRRLAGEHDRAPERDDAEWLAALEAMDEDPRQRQLAIEADPLLMFRRLPAAEAIDDIESMKAAVSSLRRASAIEAEQPRRPMAGWSVAAFLTLGVAAALLTGSEVTRGGLGEAVGSGLVVAGSEADAATRAVSLVALELPLVEDADPTSDLLMQIEDDDLSLVVVLTGDQDV